MRDRAASPKLVLAHWRRGLGIRALKYRHIDLAGELMEQGIAAVKRILERG